MLCKDLMKKNVKYCSPEDPVHAAAALMRDENIGFVPICDESRRVLGTLTDRDIVIRCVAEEMPYETPCERVMTKNPITVRQDARLNTALSLMSKHHISRALIVDGKDALVGVISLSDIAQEADDKRIADTMRHVTNREAALH